MNRTRISATGAVLAVLLAGCGGGGDDKKTALTTPAKSNLPASPAKAPPPTPQTRAARLTTYEREQVKQALIVVDAKCGSAKASDNAAYAISIFLDGLLTPLLSKPDARYGAGTLRTVGKATEKKLDVCVPDQAERISSALGGR